VLADMEAAGDTIDEASDEAAVDAVAAMVADAQEAAPSPVRLLRRLLGRAV
jgi:hypothetical protein